MTQSRMNCRYKKYQTLMVLLTVTWWWWCNPEISGCEAAEVVAPISATFLQYQGWMKTLPLHDWTSELEAMKRAKIDVVIIQWMQHNQEQYFIAEFNQITELILSYADRNNLSVYLGLRFDDDWWQGAERPNSRYFGVDSIARKSGKLIRGTHEILPRLAKYTMHKSFKGWYIPQEPWNQVYSQSEEAAIHRWLKRTCELSVETRAGRILISPMFNPVDYKSGTPTMVEQSYTRMLTKSGVTDVLVQDGVGARGWNEARSIEQNVPSYLRAYKRAAHAAGAKFWCNLECFDQNLQPTTIDRLKTQIAISLSLADTAVGGRRQVAMFDFFHYMSPVHEGDTKLKRTKLFKDYLRVYNIAP